MRIILSILTILGMGAAATYFYVKYYHTTGTANFRIAQVERGDMLPTIGATGTLEPEQVVDIGSQVNGLITDLKVDYGSVVDKGTLLATVDETMYKATVDQNQAALNRAKADLGQMNAKLAQSQADLKRDDELIKKSAIAQSDYDAAKAAYEVAKAMVGVDEAAIKQAEATLKQSVINLGYCEIKSPVKGVIVDRRVNVGQTVVSNLSASSLFLLAKDLSRIQVWASVNEADIGRIVPGVKVHFTVDAYPNETFVGEVLQVRLNATMTQNVVTYTVVVTTENKEVTLPSNVSASPVLPGNLGPRYKLLPYMTANLLFEIERHENVLKVPNAALRWKPRPQQIAPDVRAETLKAMNSRDDKSKRREDSKDKPAKGSGQSVAEAPPRDVKSAADGQASAPATPASSATGVNPQDWKARTDKRAHQDGKPNIPAASQKAKVAGDKRQPANSPLSGEAAAAMKEHHESSRVWVVDGEFVRPIPVKIIATDGTMTEVRGQDIVEGMEVAIGESVVADDSGETTNPFMPKLFKGGSKPK
jgi:HlyD family secretion protein